MTPSLPERGSIWLADLDPVIRNEQGGARPVIVVSATAFNAWPVGLVVVVPLTTKDRGFSHHIRVVNAELEHVSFAMPEYMRSVSQQRLRRSLGQASPTTMNELSDWLRRILALPA